MKRIRSRGEGGFAPLDSRGRHLTGFTLIETIVAITMLGVVGLSFAYLYITSQRFMIQSVNFTSSQTDAAFAIEHIKRHLTVATEVSEPAAVGLSSHVLKFKWRPTAADSEQASSYQLDGTNLQFIPDTGGAPEPIARGILSIDFIRATAGTISIDVTAQNSSGGDTRKMRLQTNISPRGLPPQ